ncbi:T9SS type A sorting domain-containing protein [bacterium]|nr:T9SS type A sorting domain-containing protein [bacterium]
MRRSLQFFTFTLTVMLSSIAFYTFGQTPTVNVFEERFDGPTIKMTSSSASGLNNNRWAITNRVGAQGSTPYSSDSAQVVAGDILYLTTDPIDLTPYVSALLSFDHVAKIEGGDRAHVELSIDNGATWIHLGKNNTNYQGQTNMLADSAWSEFSDVIGWRGAPTQANRVAYPQPSWFRKENFDISELAGGQSNVRIRFVLRDMLNSDSGPSGRAGWFLDNVIVAGAFCELFPPAVNLSAPSSYPGSYGDGRVYDTGPFDFIASVTDQSGLLLDSTYVAYARYDNSNPRVLIVRDTVKMVNVSAANFRGTIPAANVGDSIRYSLIYTDASGCFNKTRFPLAGERYMIIYPDLPQPCQQLPEFQFPYKEDFESFPRDETGKMYNNWVNLQGDFHDWWVGVDSTLTNGTGPKGGKSGIKFLYLEATGHVGQEAHIVSPCLDFFETPNPTLEFWYHMNGQNIDELHIDIYDETIPGWVNDVAPPIIGNQGDFWRLKQINFYNYRDRVVQIRLRAKAGKGGDIGDIAIDDFYIYNGPIHNAAVVEVYRTPFTPKVNDQLSFRLENFGVLPITTLSATYNIYDRFNNLESTVTETFNGLNVPPAATQDLTFSTPFLAPDSIFFAQVIVNLAMDTANNNDTNIAQSYGVNKRPISYYDNYDVDSRADDWVNFPLQVGVPDKWKRLKPGTGFGEPKQAFSPDYVWSVNGTQKYGPGSDNQLISPFIDMRNSDSTFVQFYMQRDIANLDGVHLEYSLDRGATWRLVADDNNPPATLNWYNSINYDGIPCWADTTGGYKLSRIKTTYLDDLDEVLFRFRFMSDTNDFAGFGAAVDNFNIINPQPLDVAVTGVFSPLSYCDIDSAKVEFKLENYGRTSMSSIPVVISVIDENNNTVSSINETVNANLGVFDSVRVTSTGWVKLPRYGNYKVQVVSNLAGDGDARNDTAFKFTESYYGCNLTLRYSTSLTIGGEGSWEVLVNNASPERRLIEKTDTLLPSTTYTKEVCIKDGQEVKVNLKDGNSNLIQFEVLGFGYSYWRTLGGNQNINSNSFDWDCPPKLSMGVTKIDLQGLAGNLPFAIDYPIEITLLDNGLDSIDDVKVNLQIDNDPVITESLVFDPELRYKDVRKHLFQNPWSATPGIHKIKAWTSEPNSNNFPDTDPTDDTAYFDMHVLDTVKAVSVNNYCNDFENVSKAWRGLNFSTYTKLGNSFQLGTGTKPNLNTSNSGQNSWITTLDSNYVDYDSSSVVSDFFQLKAQKCYEVSFFHKFETEEDNDGGHFQYSINNGQSWITLYDNSGTATEWFNTQHVAAMLNNSQNAGWTGTSAWIQSKNTLGLWEDKQTIFRFRYQSDGSVRNEGWQIDDFCINEIAKSDSLRYQTCFPVGLNTFNSKNISLSQNVPNPTNGVTTITYGLTKSGQVNFNVTNMLGQTFAQTSEFMSAGDHMIELNVAEWADGVYFYSIEFEGERIVKKMIISK